MMEHCVVTELGLHPRMNSHEAMIECCGPEFRIGVHEYEQTMHRIGGLYAEILQSKFEENFGEKYEAEVQEFLFNMKDFVQRDFNVEESLVHSITGAKLIVNEKLYQDLVNASKDELADMEKYRQELMRGRDVIIHKIRSLFEEREEQLAELLEEEKRQAADELAEAEKQAKIDQFANEAADFRNSDEEEKEGKAGLFSEISDGSGSESDGDSESSEEGGESEEDEDSSEGGSFNNFDDFDKKNTSEESEETDYDAKTISDAIFDQFRDKDEENEKMEVKHQEQIDEEWDNLRRKGKIHPKLDYIDGGHHVEYNPDSDD